MCNEVIRVGSWIRNKHGMVDVVPERWIEHALPGQNPRACKVLTGVPRSDGGYLVEGEDGTTWWAPAAELREPRPN